MKLTAALECEKIREDAENWNKVILHKDGRFYHAYEWSAWLVKKFVCTEELQRARKDNSMLLAQRFVTKNNDYVMLGFPVETISKYIPEYEDVRAMEGDDLEVTVTLPAEDDRSYEAMKAVFDEWRGGLPVKEAKKTPVKDVLKGANQAAVLSQSGLFQIVVQIMAYPVENTTPIQNAEFISNLKQQVARLL